MGDDITPHFFWNKYKIELSKGDKIVPEQESVYTPNKMYEVKVKIKDLDYTNDLISLTLSSSLSTAYQVIELMFSLDPNDIITEDIFGGEPIKLTITLYREQDYPGPQVDIELLYLNASFQLTQKDEMSQQQMKDRTLFSVTTVARKPFQTMSSLVNDVFLNTTLDSVINSLASDIDTTVSYDSDGQNTTAIEQVCIPPTTFYKIIKEYNKANEDMFDGFLDQRFGLFSGVPGVFCQYDNKVHIKNLSSRVQKNQTFTVYQLAGQTDSKLADKIYDESLGGDVFYTYDIIQTEYAGNARFAELGYDIHQIVKPKDALTNTVSLNLDTVAQNNSLLYSKNNKSLFLDSVVKRTKYYNEDTGNESDTHLFESRFGRTLSTLSSISLNLERNLPVLNLIEVGECVKFKPFTIEYADFEGKYILWSSVIKFVREGPTWATTAQINLMRTNKKN
jgi:hypothetical protein